MIRNSALREVVRSDPFTSVAGANLTAAFRRNLIVLLLQLHIVQTRSEYLERLILILNLRFFVLTGDDKTGRNMGQTHRGVSRVDTLPAVAGGTVYIDTHIVRVDLYLYVIHLRQYCHRRRRRMNTTGAFRLWYTLHAVCAGFVFESGICTLALDQHACFFDTADTGIVGVHDLGLPAAALRVTQIHTQKVLREQRRLFTAGTRAHFQNNVLFIVRVLRQQQDLELFLHLRDLILVLCQLHLGQLTQLRVAGIQHFPSLRDSLFCFFVFPVFVDDRLHFAHLFDMLLPELLVIDDVRIRNFQRQFFVFFQYEIEFIKHLVLLQFILF